jgi:TRAP-type C4-dicarboxylate transport system permease small subunit
VRVVLLGVALGAIWGSVMWVISELSGRDSGVRGWIYLALTVAMIGGGVAAAFGVFAIRRGGEPASPADRPHRRGRKR